MSFASFCFIVIVSAGFYGLSKFCWGNIIKIENEFNLKNVLKFLGLETIVFFINLVFCYTVLCSNGVSIVFDDGEVLPGLNSNVVIYTEKVGN